VSKEEKIQEAPEVKAKKAFTLPAWTVVLSWGVTIVLVAGLILLLLQINPFSKEPVVEEAVAENTSDNIPLPNLVAGLPVGTLFRITNLDTSVPEGVRQFPVQYTVEEGDSMFAIAKKYDITPETILFANYDYFYDDGSVPLVPGWKLTIPPTNGVYYKWKDGDTLDKVAGKFYANVDDIITWPGNGIDVTDPVILPDTTILIPDGYRVVSWITPVEFATRSGVTQTIAGIGGCIAPETGPVGSTAFQWPVGEHYLSGYDFSASHLGIDIAAGVGTPVLASDAGTVVYAGWNDTGYGNMVAIDHNNGYKTIYAHLSSINVACGSSVNSGALIGYSGSTGKSTGGHLHFEIRYYSTFINPWQVLP
jgi:LysM repeat protein